MLTRERRNVRLERKPVSVALGAVHSSTGPVAAAAPSPLTQAPHPKSWMVQMCDSAGRLRWRPFVVVRGRDRLYFRCVACYPASVTCVTFDAIGWLDGPERPHSRRCFLQRRQSCCCIAGNGNARRWSVHLKTDGEQKKSSGSLFRAARSYNRASTAAEFVNTGGC